MTEEVMWRVRKERVIERKEREEETETEKWSVGGRKEMERGCRWGRRCEWIKIVEG
jgi:hypothetical protein